LLGTDRRRAIPARKGTQMKIDEILTALRDERQQLDEVILRLERIDHGKGQLKKLGRPPGTKNQPKMVPLAV
jgi:hypothetical protein